MQRLQFQPDPVPGSPWVSSASGWASKDSMTVSLSVLSFDVAPYHSM